MSKSPASGDSNQVALQIRANMMKQQALSSPVSHPTPVDPKHNQAQKEQEEPALCLAMVLADPGRVFVFCDFLKRNNRPREEINAFDFIGTLERAKALSCSSSRLMKYHILFNTFIREGCANPLCVASQISPQIISDIQYHLQSKIPASTIYDPIINLLLANKEICAQYELFRKDPNFAYLDLLGVLLRADRYSAFLSFARDSYQEEHVMFWRAIQNLEHKLQETKDSGLGSPLEEAFELVDLIWDIHLKPNAEFKLKHVSDSIRQTLLLELKKAKKSNAIRANIFYPVLHRCMDVMKFELFEKFLFSPNNEDQFLMESEDEGEAPSPHTSLSQTRPSFDGTSKLNAPFRRRSISSSELVRVRTLSNLITPHSPFRNPQNGYLNYFPGPGSDLDAGLSGSFNSVGSLGSIGTSPGSGSFSFFSKQKESKRSLTIGSGSGAASSLPTSSSLDSPVSTSLVSSLPLTSPLKDSNSSSSALLPAPSPSSPMTFFDGDARDPSFPDADPTGKRSRRERTSSTRERTDSGGGSDESDEDSPEAKFGHPVQRTTSFVQDDQLRQNQPRPSYDLAYHLLVLEHSHGRAIIPKYDHAVDDLELERLKKLYVIPDLGRSKLADLAQLRRRSVRVTDAQLTPRPGEIPSRLNFGPPSPVVGTPPSPHFFRHPQTPPSSQAPPQSPFHPQTPLGLRKGAGANRRRVQFADDGPMPLSFAVTTRTASESGCSPIAIPRPLSFGPGSPGVKSALKPREETFGEMLKRVFKERDEAGKFLSVLAGGAMLTKMSPIGLPSSRWFAVSKDGAELSWGKVDIKKKTKRMSLFSRPRKRMVADIMRMRYGSRWSRRFTRYNQRGDAPWLAFTVVFPDRTLDIVCESEVQVTTWFLGLQSLAPLAQTYLTKGALLWRRAGMKIKHKAKTQKTREKEVIDDLLGKAMVATGKKFTPPPTMPANTSKLTAAAANAADAAATAAAAASSSKRTSQLMSAHLSQGSRAPFPLRQSMNSGVRVDTDPLPASASFSFSSTPFASFSSSSSFSSSPQSSALSPSAFSSAPLPSSTPTLMPTPLVIPAPDPAMLPTQEPTTPIAADPPALFPSAAVPDAPETSTAPPNVARDSATKPNVTNSSNPDVAPAASVVTPPPAVPSPLPETNPLELSLSSAVGESGTSALTTSPFEISS